MINDRVGFVVHSERYAIIGSLSQEENCDNRDCDNRSVVPNGAMSKRVALRPEFAEVFERLDRAGRSQRQLADVLGIEENKVSSGRCWHIYAEITKPRPPRSCATGVTTLCDKNPIIAKRRLRNFR